MDFLECVSCSQVATQGVGMSQMQDRFYLAAQYEEEVACLSMAPSER